MRVQSFLYAIVILVGFLLTAYAVYEAFKLTAIHLGGTPVCPQLFGIPACLIVLICYVLIALAWVVSPKANMTLQANIIFLLGFLPAFLLALAGSAGEIFNFASCPHTATGFPKCFLSFGFLIFLAVCWSFAGWLRKRI